MAFEKGIAQTIHVTTYLAADHVTPTAPGTPVGTISVDGGATFGAAAAKSCSNSAAADTTTATGNWTQATHGGLWTANAAGTFIWGYALTAPQTILTGFFFRAAIGEIVVKVDPV